MWPGSREEWLVIQMRCTHLLSPSSPPSLPSHLFAHPAQAHLSLCWIYFPPVDSPSPCGRGDHWWPLNNSLSHPWLRKQATFSQSRGKGVRWWPRRGSCATLAHDSGWGGAAGCTWQPLSGPTWSEKGGKNFPELPKIRSCSGEINPGLQHIPASL